MRGPAGSPAADLPAPCCFLDSCGGWPRWKTHPCGCGDVEKCPPEGFVGLTEGETVKAEVSRKGPGKQAVINVGIGSMESRHYFWDL